ncbi:MAG TPA: hypothetical protein ENN80_10580 [Candidatus Hydrogenedentes bacterium]|nr:hypothetical protein [Candidatus Hydrogenedentota bacterium]
MRTLVVHSGGIGDFLLACPAIKRLYEDGPVELLGRPDRLSLAVAGGIAEAAHDINTVGFETLFAEPSPSLLNFLERYDRCIVWMRDDGAIARGLLLCGVPQAYVYPGLPPDEWAQHASQYYLDCLGLGDAPPLRLDIRPVRSERDIVIHPGSGGKSKNWPLECFLAVADLLERGGRSIAYCLGPAEESLVVPESATLLRAESVLELAHELAAARLYIGNDSGITHLAAAVGCPTVAIFGPTDPSRWAPLGDHVRVVQGAPWPDADTVLRTACAITGVF